jgi:hypothetical protein
MASMPAQKLRRWPLTQVTPPASALMVIALGPARAVASQDFISWRAGAVPTLTILIRPFCITILYHNLLLFIDIFHI